MIARVTAYWEEGVTQRTTHPTQAIPIRLGGDEHGAHLTQNWQATLCGERILDSMTWPHHYRWGDCSVCWQLATERGLKIESQL